MRHLIQAVIVMIYLCAPGVSMAEKNKKKAPTTNRAVAKLTEKEKQLVRKAKKIFKDGKNDPPPTVHMMDKMQSGVPQ